MHNQKKTSKMSGVLFCLSVALIIAALYGVYDLSLAIGRATHRTRPGSTPAFIQILPGDYFSLVKSPIAVANPATVKDIITALATAKSYSPNHPQTRWQCYMIISDASGNSYYCVNDTTGQGVILYKETSMSGFIFSTRRSDTLEGVLEKAAASSVP
jgi:hypothetical protein